MDNLQSATTIDLSGIDLDNTTPAAVTRFRDEIRRRSTRRYYFFRLLDARGDTEETANMLSAEDLKEIWRQVDAEFPRYIAVVEMAEMYLDPWSEQALKILELLTKAFEYGIDALATDYETCRRPFRASMTGNPRRAAF